MAAGDLRLDLALAGMAEMAAEELIWGPEEKLNLETPYPTAPALWYMVAKAGLRILIQYFPIMAHP